MPGTYPHHEWQGSRIEGLVIGQGERISADYSDQMRQVAQSLAAQVVHAADVEKAGLLRFASDSFKVCS